MINNYVRVVKNGVHYVFKGACNVFAGSGLGKNRLISTVYHRLLPVFRPEKVKVDGHTLFLDNTDAMALSVFGVYEPEVGAAIKDVVKPGMTVIDLGQLATLL
jgi:hypothetical protein